MVDKDKELQEEEGEEPVDHKDQLLHQEALMLLLMLDMGHQEALEELEEGMQEIPEVWKRKKIWNEMFVNKRLRNS